MIEGSNRPILIQNQSVTNTNEHKNIAGKKKSEL